MKALQLKITNSTTSRGKLSIRTVEGAMYGHIQDDIKAAGFVAGDLVTLVDSREWERLQAREAYRVHCAQIHGCKIRNRDGSPLPVASCPDGQRLAAAIGDA